MENILSIEQYYNDLDDRPEFTMLTKTGISDNLKNVFNFADSYHSQKSKCIIKDIEDRNELLNKHFLNEDSTLNYVELRTLSIQINFNESLLKKLQ